MISLRYIITVKFILLAHCFRILFQESFKNNYETAFFANEGPSSQSYGFSSSQVWMESWTIKKAEH